MSFSVKKDREWYKVRDSTGHIGYLIYTVIDVATGIKKYLSK